MISRAGLGEEIGRFEAAVEAGGKFAVVILIWVAERIVVKDFELVSEEIDRFGYQLAGEAVKPVVFVGRHE